MRGDGIGTAIGEVATAWRRQRRLALVAVFAALAIALGLPAITQTLNLVKVAGFPLGFYLAAQGAPLVIGAIVFLYARRANRLSRIAAREAGPRE